MIVIPQFIPTKCHIQARNKYLYIKYLNGIYHHKNIVRTHIAFLIALFTRVNTFIHSDDQSKTVNTSSPRLESTINEYTLGTYYFFTLLLDDEVKD